MELDTVRFVPAKSAPSDSEDTTYFVFADYTDPAWTDGYIEVKFAGVIAHDGCGWTYYVDGEPVTDSYPDRCDLFNYIKQDPCIQA